MVSVYLKGKTEFLAISFREKTIYQVIWNPLLYTNLFVQDVISVTVVKLKTI